MENLPQRLRNRMERIRIIADDRERRVVEQLRASPRFDVVVQRLSVGDYRLDGRFLFERKTLPDLAESIKSGRLFSQALRLAQVGNVRPALILEGTLKDLQGCGMRWEAVQGALVTVALCIGLPVLRTRSTAETVRTFLYAALQGRAAIAGALPRPGRRPKGKVALQHHILQGLPGVGPRRAAQLLAQFGSVRAVLAADESELESVPGVGEHIARRIVWAVKEADAHYGAGAATFPSQSPAITPPPSYRV